MAGSKSATPLAKEVKADHNVSVNPPPRGLPGSKKKAPVIVISDSEDDNTPTLKRDSRNISGSREANPRPVKKAATTLRSPAHNSLARRVSATSKTTHGDTTPASRLEIAQKQTRLANSQVADLEGKLEDVKAELLATKNTLSHRDAEVKSYQQMESELMRITELLTKKEAELEGVTNEKNQLIELSASQSVESGESNERIKQLTAENKKLSEQLADTARNTEAHVAGTTRVSKELTAAKAKQFETEARLLECRDKLSNMEDDLEEARKAVATSDALYDSQKDAFDQAREAHTDIKNERDTAIALADLYKQHIDALKESLSVANKHLDRARIDESDHMRRIEQLEEEIHDLESLRDGLESTCEEIMTKLDSVVAKKEAAEAEKKAAEAREKVTEKRQKEQITELLNEIAAVKIEVIVLSERKEALDVYHNEAVSFIDTLEKEFLEAKKKIKELEAALEPYIMSDEKREGWHRIAEELRARSRATLAMYP